MKKLMSLALLGVLAFAVFLVAGMPAAVVWQLADDQKMVPANLTVSGIEGRLWAGSAQNIEINGEVLPETSWAVSSESLFFQRLVVDIQAGHSRSELFVEGQLSWDGEQLEITAGKGRIIREKVQELLELPLPVAIDGLLSFTIPELVVSKGQCSTLTGEGSLSQAEALTPFGDVDLGQISFDLNCQDNRINVVAKQSSTELQVSAKVIIDMKGRYTVSGQLKPQSELAEPFRNSLAFLGKANANGEYPLRTRGTL